MRPIIQSLFILALSPCIASVSFAGAPSDPFALKIVREDDLQLSCDALVSEAMLMRDIIQTTEDIKTDSDLNGHAVTAAGAIGSFLVGSVTGGLGLAAAGFVASQGVEASGDKAETIQDIAFQRRALMVGIHQAKGCETSIEAALAPIDRKTVFEAGEDKLAKLEPASGKPKKAAPLPDYND